MKTRTIPLARRISLLTRLSKSFYVDSVSRQLAQLGFTWEQSSVLAEKITPPGRVTVPEYLSAIRVVNHQQSLTSRIRENVTNGNVTDPEKAFHETAKLITSGGDVFEEFVSMNAKLVANGFGERRLPRTYDQQFWESQKSERDMFKYLSNLEEIQIPEGAR